jgi:transcription antitermination protein NusB
MINSTNVPIEPYALVEPHTPVETHEHVEALEPPLIETDECFENDPARDRTLPKRRLARERVMQILYAYELGGSDIETLRWELIERDLAKADETDTTHLLNDSESSESARAFARELTNEIMLHREEINQIITEKLQRWEFSRVALIDRILIQMGIAELLYFPDIPPKASINELIEIAKDYSTEESGKFINGILHAIMTHLNETGRINKSGRGLLEESQSGYRPAKTNRK